MQPATIRNAMTIDVEDYFQVSAFAGHVPRGRWPSIACRVEPNVERILALLDTAGVHATFFTLGWIARRHPHMVRRVAAAGHEIASHGYAHVRASEQSRSQFRRDIVRSRYLLEDLCGTPVTGYRAPSFSIDGRNLWAFDALADAGYRYSSSIYPIAHDHYGMPEAPRFAHYPAGHGGILELPVSTARVLRHNVPAGGGGYFRLYPYVVSRWLLRRINRREQRAGIFYFHPWELDPAQPRLHGLGMTTRFRHYLNLDRTERRIAALTRDFHWGRMDQIFPVAP